MILTEDRAALLPIIPRRDRRPAWANNPADTVSKTQEENITMTEPTTLSTAQKLQAHAARILGKPSSKVEAQLLARIAKLSDQLLEIEAESRDIGDLKRDTVSLTGAERRALAAPLVTGETFPPVLKDHAAIATAIGILIRFVPELVEARRTYLTGQQDAVAAQAVPIRAELVQLRDQLAAVQKELAAS